MKKILVAVFTQGFIQIVGLATGIIVARALGPTGRGELATVLVWTSALTYIGDAGLPVAYSYAAARHPLRIPQLLCNAVIATAIQWLAIGAVGTALVWAVVHGQDPATARFAIGYLWLYVPLNLTTRYILAIRQAAADTTSFNALRASIPIAYAAVLIALTIAGSLSIRSVLAASLFSNVVGVVAALIVVFRAQSRVGAIPFRFAPDMAALRRDVGYGLSAHVGSLQPFHNMQLDILVLSFLLSPHEIGLYAAASAGANIVKAQGASLGYVVLPDVARHRDVRLQLDAARRLFPVAALLGGGAAIVAFAWGDQIVPIVYGSAFASAAPLLKILTLGSGASILYRVTADALRGMGRPALSTGSEVLGVLVAVAAMLVLVPRFGAAGGAAAVSVAAFASATAALMMLRRVCRTEASTIPLADRAAEA